MNDIQKSLDHTLSDSNLIGIGANLTEITIDSIMKDCLLKDVPIVNTLISLTKFGANIKDRLFLKKDNWFFIKTRKCSTR